MAYTLSQFLFQADVKIEVSSQMEIEMWDLDFCGF